MTGWRLSGFRRVAHLVYEGSNGLSLARCGAVWWMSDGVSSSAANSDTPRCKRCQRWEVAHAQ